MSFVGMTAGGIILIDVHVRNLVLFREPGPEIDESAAITAERAIRRSF